MNRPTFPFWVENWMGDKGLRKSSPAARAVWMDLMCLMHQSVPYGHLSDASGPYTDAFMAQWCGISSIAKFRVALAELEANEVPSRTPEGTLYSRKMARDEKRRMGGYKSLEHPNSPQRKGTLPPGIYPAAAAAEGSGNGNRKTAACTFAEFAKSAAAIREADVTAEDDLIEEILQAAQAAHISVAGVLLPDEIMADCIRNCKKENQKSAALFKRTLPQAIRSWHAQIGERSLSVGA